MVKLTEGVIDLSEEMAATGYPGPYDVKVTTPGGKTGTETLFIQVSPKSHPDVVIHTQVTVRDLMNQRIEIDYVSIMRNYDPYKDTGLTKRRKAAWKRDFYTPPKKPQQPNELVQRLLDRLGGVSERTTS